MFDLTATILMSVGLLYVTASVYQVSQRYALRAALLNYISNHDECVPADAAWCRAAFRSHLLCHIPEAQFEQKQHYWHCLLLGKLLQCVCCSIEHSAAPLQLMCADIMQLSHINITA